MREKLDLAMTSLCADEILISSLNVNLIRAYKAEEDFWKQRSRQLWLELGDRNTGYFHASTKARRARNRITTIEDHEGLPVYENGKIAEVISNYFSNIFTSSNPLLLTLLLKRCLLAFPLLPMRN